MKNPWMSMWLSAANSWTSAARGQAAAEAKRTQNAFLKDAQKQMMDFWMPGSPADQEPVRKSSPKKRKRAAK